MLHRHHESVASRVRDTLPALSISASAIVYTLAQAGVCQSCVSTLRHRAYEADLVLHNHHERVYYAFATRNLPC